MEKNAIKKFAVWARTEMLTRVAQRAARYGIEKDNVVDRDADSINGILLSETEKAQRRALIRQIEEKGYDQVIEEVAYTWFNRFIALRFMEVNGYLPSHIRVFTNENNEFKPELLSEAINLDFPGLDMQKVYQLQDENKIDELYRYLLIVQCNDLNSVLPKMFQHLNDYTELLLPDNLLRNGSVLEQMIALIPEEDWKDQVQIIGWLYQYYNSGLKDEVFANLKKKVKISKDSIPAATQLFTPDWIVRYMVDNSLGRLWYEGHPSEVFKEKLEYYIDDAEQEASVQAQVDAIKQKYGQLKPEEIKCIDPCCGSGHILTYFFDVLMNIYQEYGYTTREAAISIIENNIWGLDIDARASQLAYFSLMMKARAYDRRFFNRHIQPHVYEILESNNLDRSLLEEIYEQNEDIEPAIRETLDRLYDAKEYGSILRTKSQDWDAIYKKLSEPDSIYGEFAKKELIPVLKVGQALSQQYDVVVTNPPYMSSSGMDKKLSCYVKKNFPNSKANMFAVFIEVCGNLTKKDGLYGMITQQSWMFLSSFEKLRKELQKRATINMVHLGAKAFNEIGGEVVQTTTFVKAKHQITKFISTYIRVVDFNKESNQQSAVSKAIADRDCGYCFERNSDDFEKVPGTPIAYWMNSKVLNLYKCKKINDYAKACKGLDTGNNDLFLRLWPEVSNKTMFVPDGTPFIKEKANLKKWFPYNKGGSFRKWYGNNAYVINFSNNGRDVIAYPKSNLRNMEQYFQNGVTWSTVNSGLPSFRYFTYGFIFDNGGSCLFSDQYLLYLQGFLNSSVAQTLLSVQPTLNTQPGMIGSLPALIRDTETVVNLVKENIEITKKDWDLFEISWDFLGHPLIFHDERHNLIESIFNEWRQESIDRFNKLKNNEELLNKIFVQKCNLQNIVNIEVDDRYVSVRLADLNRDIRSLISYAVGCMFGRYSLDKEGLIYAGGEWDASQYKTYPADEDNILPITDDEYFEDDIVDRFVKFVETVYGKDALEENLKFIADALEVKGTTPREVIRNYFLNDFFKDHCQTYSVTGSGKRPIYWLFDSGKKNGFKCLIYMHRYTPDTLARIRTDYVHPQQARYQTAIDDIERQLVSATGSEKVRLNKQLKKLKGQAEETRVFEEKLHHLADQMIDIDLDDGVKHNYALFKDVLAKIK
ncbi:BREX-1 system adenine-specific DNA-methyltransferase PglX [Lactobacillus delbrueckii]|uniref:BREX-1 system adenine-specific DNA-methyltransferase PglX n=1 Tax=Lactobacillus delbrueckii TaxID=1584 RepID=UPI001F289B32|nr:BREX-1 system adenine-specific DNA-methyltransferase PglX [Lactobacillus delbrueckii]GHN53712.1 restriction endonuclease subunit M [Lactobacillus delbrueckii]